MNKEDILIALKEIHARYCIPASEQNYTDKDYACMQYEKLVIHLSNQLDKYKEVLDKIKEYIENNKYKKMGSYGDNEDEDIEVCLFENDIWEILELLEEIE